MERIKLIDFLRGIGIIFVIVGHSIEPRPSIIYSFHVPLFFFLSGFTFSKKEITFYSYLKSKIYTLIIPYIVFSLISFCYFILLSNKEVYDFDNVLTFKRIFYFSGINGGNDTLWFLTCLFALNIMYFTIHKFIKNSSLMNVIVISLSIIGYLYAFLELKNLPFRFEVALVSLPFYQLGIIVKKHGLLPIVGKLKRKTAFTLITIIFMTYYLLTELNLKLSDIDYVTMIFRQYGNYFLFYLNAILGIILTIIIVNLVYSLFEKNRLNYFNNLFIYIGFKSLFLLFSHKLILFSLDFLLNMYNISINQEVKVISYSLIAVIISLALLKFLSFIKLMTFKCKTQFNKRIK